MNFGCISTLLPGNCKLPDVKQTHIELVKKTDIIFFILNFMLKI